MHIDKRALLFLLLLNVACSPGGKPLDAEKHTEAWVPTTPEETRMLDAITTENDGLEANKTQNWATARAKFQAALELYQAVPGTDQDQASCFWRLGSAYDRLGDYENAKKAYRDAIAKFDAAATARPAPPSAFIRQIRHKPDDPTAMKGVCFHSIGRIAGMKGDFQEAKINMEQAVALLGSIENPAPSTRGMLAKSYELLGLASEKLGLSKEAGEAASRAKQLRDTQ